MADRPNNFGEVLFKALGNTAKEAPSIFDNAAIRKKAEALHLFDAMLKLQDAQRSDQQLKIQQAQQQQQAQLQAANMAHVQAETAKLQYEMSQPYRDWVKQREKDQIDADYSAKVNYLKQLRDAGINTSGNAPSNTGGVGGSFYLTPDDLVRRAQGKQSALVSQYNTQIEQSPFGEAGDPIRAAAQAQIDQIMSPEWMQANLDKPTDSLGIPANLINPAAMTAQPQPQPQPQQQSMTRAILEDGVKTGKLKKTDPQYIKWDKYFKARNQ